MAWPPAVSDGLTLHCSDCGKIPRFDFSVTDEFWKLWVPDNPARLGVVCLTCLDARCGGVGLMEALEEVQYIGNGFTVVLSPSLRVDHCRGVVETGKVPSFSAPLQQLDRISDSLFEESDDIGQNAPRPPLRMREFLEACGDGIREAISALGYKREEKD